MAFQSHLLLLQGQRAGSSPMAAYKMPVPTIYYLNRSPVPLRTTSCNLPCIPCSLPRHRHCHRHRPCVAHAKKAQAAEEEYLSPPFLSEITEHLTGTEPVPAPLWGTWCGTIQGLWVGTTAAYAPFTGKPEPISLAEDGRTKLYEMSQCCVEERVVDEESDRMVRHTARASSQAQLNQEMAEGGRLQFEEAGGSEWDTEELLLGQDGLFIFDGGSYSSGPVELFRAREEGASGDAVSPAAEGGWEVPEDLDDDFDEEEEEDDDEDDFEAWLADDGKEELADDAPGQASVIEACIQWNGEQRIRVRLMLSCSLLQPEVIGEYDGSIAPELDVSLLRVVVCREGWEGMPGQYTSPSQPDDERAAQQASAGTRLQPSDTSGFWNEFEVSATTVDDVDMRTGLRAMMPFYSSREVQRLVAPMSASGSGNGGRYGGDGGDVDGGALWLPHRTAVQLTMGGGEAGCLEVEVQWSPEPKLVLGMKRRYSSDGKLLEVVSMTGIRAGVS